MIEGYLQQFEKYLQLFDKLKEKKFSRLVHLVREKILEMLNSDKFSEHVHRYMQNINANGEPFTNFSNEPAQISQLKKIINALYHAELTLTDVETVDFRAAIQADPRGAIADIHYMYSKSTVHHAYQACYLATHFDLDLRDMFSQELDALTPVFMMFRAFAKDISEETRGYLSQIDLRTLPHKMGVVGGVIIDQLDPLSEEIDYAFIARFSADLPGYLDQLRGYIQRCSSQLTEFEPNINKRELEALQDNALQLLSALDQTHGSHLFLPIKALHYIHIIRHTIVLSMSIFEQAGHLSDSGQDSIRAKLAELKYKLLPMLFGLTDKIEENAMLTPGVLSNPLMGHASGLYQSLIEYTSKFVDFKTKGQHLVAIEDSKFVAERLEYTYQRLMENHQALLLAAQVKNAAKQFFELLKHPDFKGMRLLELPDPIKRQLRTYYKLIQPDVLQFNIPMNNAIVSGLTDSTGAFNRITRLVNHTDGIRNVLLLQPQLNDRLEKTIASHGFRIQLNNDLIASISEHVGDMKLFPHKPSGDPFAINEANIFRLESVAENGRLNNEPRPFTAAQALSIANNDIDILRFGTLAAVNNGLMTLEQLTMTQKSTLYQMYQMNCLKLERAQSAYQAFYQILIGHPSTWLLKDFYNESKNILRNLYSVFQPYLVGGLILNEVRDEAIIDALSTRTDTLPQSVDVASILVLNEQIISRFSLEKERLNDRKEVLSHAVQESINVACQEKDLIKDASENNAAHELIKDYSKSIAAFRTSLDQLTAVFNESVRSQLKQAKTGLPFPELTDVNQTLAQSSQALGLKRLFNCLYHLENIIGNLASLNDKSSEVVYIKNVLRIGAHLNEANDLAQALIATPYLWTIAGDVQQKCQSAYATLLNVRSHYIPGGELADLPRDHSAVIFYTLNALMVSPEHITALRQDQVVSQGRVDAMHLHTEQVTADIERILSNASSYFKLFFETPTMYRLFGELKKKLTELSAVSHDVVMDNLAVINDELFTKMLLEADRWEDNSGLIPGTLTNAMKEMFDAFYEGLLEPLGLKSRRHIELVASTLPVEQRLLAATERFNTSRNDQGRIAEKQYILRELCKRIDVYRNVYRVDTAGVADIRGIVVDSFQKALPVLQEVKMLIGRDVQAPLADPLLDDLLNSSVVDEPTLKNIKELAAAGANYFQGMHASYQLAMDASSQKISQLNDLQSAQQALKANFIERYTKASFKRQAALFAVRPIVLRHCSEEYSRKLAEYMVGIEDEVVSTAKTAEDTAEDIDKKLGRLLREKVRAFKRENYTNYAHLNEIMVVIERLDDYVCKAAGAVDRKDFSFENDHTLETKSTLVRALKSLSKDPSKSITDRLDNLKEFIHGPTFETRMVAHHHYESFTFFWLKQCVIKLVELIGLYTPEHKKCFKRLLHVVDNPSATASQYGFFSTSMSQRASVISPPDASRSPSTEPVLA